VICMLIQWLLLQTAVPVSSNCDESSDNKCKSTAKHNSSSSSSGVRQSRLDSAAPIDETKQNYDNAHCD
jgi:hypothetical protein